MEYNSYIKAEPETNTDKAVLKLLLRTPGETEELEAFINEIARNNYEPTMSVNYKGIGLKLERVYTS